MLARIPRGKVTTYGDLGRALGDVRAARWVGEFLLDHPHSEGCRCHRVVRTGGDVGLYITRDSAEKIRRLAADGVAIEDGRVDSRALMDVEQLTGGEPLARLLAFQDALRERIQTGPLDREPTLFCGLDVAYPRGRPATGAAVILDARTLQPVWTLRRECPAPFPYISGYLSFRETPLLLELWNEARRQCGPDVVCFVDGNGMLHPRRAGVASCFGVLADVPTIGVGKSLLCGHVRLEGMSVSETRPVVHNQDVIAAAMQGKHGSRPVYVSIGHRVSLDDATRLTRQCFASHRLPAPIYHADRLSRAK